MDLPEKVDAAIRARKLFRRGQRILVAVSGGVDSMVLLHLLHKLAPRHGWQLTVAHCNHQLRGRSSDADERLVRTTAKQLGLPFKASRVDVKALARTKKLSTEMAARQLRHAFLARTARRLRIPTIALAHHVDDQVELFFLRLFRGSGGEGLSGMAWRGPSPADAKGELVRPLLEQTKAAVAEYARREQIRFREDASNQSADFQRNRIRHRLLPFLKKEFQPLLGQTVWRTMEIVGAENDAVCATAMNWRLTKKQTPFADLPKAVQRQVVQQQLFKQGIAPEFDLIEQLRTRPGTPVTINPKNSIMLNAAGQVESVRRKETGFKKTGLTQALRGRTGKIAFAGMDFRWQIEQQRGFVRPRPVKGRELFDADLVGRQVVLRHWRPGDRFQPIGMKAAVKLQDLFVNARIPHEQRRELIVATAADGQIFWVERLRIGEKFKLSAKSTRRLRWTWKKVV